MLKTVRAAARGEALFGPAIAHRLMGFFRDLNAFAQRAPSALAFPELTEREVLNLIAQGLTTPRSPTGPRPSSAPVRRAWGANRLICYSRCNCASNAGRREYFSFVFCR